MPSSFSTAERVTERVGYRREVVHALDDGLRLRPEEAFGGLLDAGVQVTDLRLGLHDVLAVDLEHDLQTRRASMDAAAPSKAPSCCRLADDVGR